MQRNTNLFKVTFDADAESSQVNFDGYAGGLIWFPSALVGENLRYKALAQDGDYHHVNKDGVPLTTPIVAGWNVLPADLFGVGEVKFESNDGDPAPAAETLTAYVRLSD